MIASLGLDGNCGGAVRRINHAQLLEPDGGWEIHLQFAQPLSTSTRCERALVRAREFASSSIGETL